MTTTIRIDGREHKVLNTGSCGPGCPPHTYYVPGFYVYEIAGVWYRHDPGQFKRRVEVVVPANVEADTEMEARMDQFRRQEAETAMGWTL